MKMLVHVQSAVEDPVTLSGLPPNRRIELLSQLLVTGISTYFGLDFFSVQINVANGQVMDIKPTFNLRAGELRKSLS